MKEGDENISVSSRKLTETKVMCIGHTGRKPLSTDRTTKNGAKNTKPREQLFQTLPSVGLFSDDLTKSVEAGV